MGRCWEKVISVDVHEIEMVVTLRKTSGSVDCYERRDDGLVSDLRRSRPTGIRAMTPLDRTGFVA